MVDDAGPAAAVGDLLAVDEHGGVGRARAVGIDAVGVAGRLAGAQVGQAVGAGEDDVGDGQTLQTLDPVLHLVAHRRHVAVAEIAEMDVRARRAGDSLRRARRHC